MKLVIALLFSVSVQAAELSFPVHGLTLSLPDSAQWATDKDFDSPHPSVSIRVYSSKDGVRQVQLLFGANQTPEKDLESFAQGLKRGLVKSGVAITSEKKTVLDKIPAMAFEGEVESDKGFRRILAIVALHKEKAYAFTLASIAGKPSGDPVLSAVAASIHIQK